MYLEVLNNKFAHTHTQPCGAVSSDSSHTHCIRAPSYCFFTVIVKHHYQPNAYNGNRELEIILRRRIRLIFVMLFRESLDVLITHMPRDTWLTLVLFFYSMFFTLNTTHVHAVRGSMYWTASTCLYLLRQLVVWEHIHTETMFPYMP